MGASSSRGGDAHASNTVVSGAHSALPEDSIPYKGPSLQYTFIEMAVQAITYMGRSMKTELQPHYESFNGPLQVGFQVTLLKTVPGCRKKNHVQHGIERRWTVPFEAIFVKRADIAPSVVGQVVIMPATIQFTDFKCDENGATYAHEVADLSDFHDKLNSAIKMGCSLVSLQATSYGKKKQQKDVKETQLELQLVFHKPFQPPPSLFVYQSIIIPLTYKVARRLPLTRRPIYDLSTDVTQPLFRMLQEGWKIVDVTYLSSQLQGDFTHRADTLTFNSMWVFEKQAAHTDDLRPQWECRVLKYTHVLKMCMNGVKTTTSWQPVIVEMGRRGWELACILDTAESRPDGMGAGQTLLLVFQRPLL